MKQIKKLMPNLTMLNGKKNCQLDTDQNKESTKLRSDNSKDASNVIKIIKKEWDREVERLRVNQENRNNKSKPEGRER